jgi:hypothetical protein
MRITSTQVSSGALCVSALPWMKKPGKSSFGKDIPDLAFS